MAHSLSISDQISTLGQKRHVASIKRRAFLFLNISDPFREIIATPLPHTARTTDQPSAYIHINSSSHHTYVDRTPHVHVLD